MLCDAYHRQTHKYTPPPPRDAHIHVPHAHTCYSLCISTYMYTHSHAQNFNTHARSYTPTFTDADLHTHSLTHTHTHTHTLTISAPLQPPTPRTPSTPSTPGSPAKHPNMAALSTLQRKKLDFSTKLQNFKIMMTRLGFSQGSRLKFNIRRDHLLEDAYEHVMKSNLKHLQMKRLNISFKGEEG